MTQEGTVVRTDEHFAYVSVKQTTACDGCHKCDGCNKEKSGCPELEVRAHNDCGCGVGDRVEIETSTGRVLLYALIVFVFPFIPAVAVYLLLKTVSEGEFFPVCGAVISLALFFLLLRVTADRNAAKRCDQRVSRIIEERNENG